jgi:muconolactone delta-isomerase
MRFLVITKQKYMVPPEVQLGLIDGSLAWSKRYSASKKLEQAWGFAGIPGGGGIADVGSLEELNQIMAENPLAAIAETEIVPLVNLEESLTLAKKVLETLVKK